VTLLFFVLVAVSCTTPPPEFDWEGYSNGIKDGLSAQPQAGMNQKTDVYKKSYNEGYGYGFKEKDRIYTAGFTAGFLDAAKTLEPMTKYIAGNFPSAEELNNFRFYVSADLMLTAYATQGLDYERPNPETKDPGKRFLQSGTGMQTIILPKGTRGRVKTIENDVISMIFEPDNPDHRAVQISFVSTSDKYFLSYDKGTKVQIGGTDFTVDYEEGKDRPYLIVELKRKDQSSSRTLPGLD
jgi:hypothetical protein